MNIVNIFARFPDSETSAHRRLGIGSNGRCARRQEFVLEAFALAIQAKYSS